MQNTGKFKKLLVTILLFLSFMFGTFEITNSAELFHKQVAEGVYGKLENRYKDKSEVEKMIIYSVLSRKLDDLVLKIEDDDIREVVKILKDMLDGKTGIATSSIGSGPIVKPRKLIKPVEETYSNPRFTKVDAEGYDLPDDATDWSCVKDNETGLIWEVKWQGIPGDPDDSGISDADKKIRFNKWYKDGFNDTKKIKADVKICTDNKGSNFYYDNSNDFVFQVSAASLGYCNFSTYLKRFRKAHGYFPNRIYKNAKFCGVKVVDFNIPKKEELKTILDKNNDSRKKIVDQYYFPGTMSGPYITGKVVNNISTKGVIGNYNLLSSAKELGYIDFGNGNIGTTAKTSENYIRLVAKFDKNKSEKKGLEKGRFIKIGSFGEELPDSAKKWSCVKDTKTNLMWEKKVNYYPNKEIIPGQAFYRALPIKGYSDTRQMFTHYSKVNPGSSNPKFGHEKTKKALGKKCFSGTETRNYYCFKDTFLERFNKDGLCGYNDWKIPSKEELGSIYDKSKRAPHINKEYFPNTRNTVYWTSTYSKENKRLLYVYDFGTRGYLGGLHSFPDTGGVWHTMRLVRKVNNSRPNDNYIQRNQSNITDLSSNQNNQQPTTRQPNQNNQQPTYTNNNRKPTYGYCSSAGSHDLYFLRNGKCRKRNFVCEDNVYTWGLNFSPSMPPESGEKLYETKSACESANNICNKGTIEARVSGDLIIGKQDSVIGVKSSTGKYYGVENGKAVEIKDGRSLCLGKGKWRYGSDGIVGLFYKDGGCNWFPNGGTERTITLTFRNSNDSKCYAETSVNLKIRK